MWSSSSTMTMLETTACCPGNTLWILPITLPAVSTVRDLSGEVIIFWETLSFRELHKKIDSARTVHLCAVYKGTAWRRLAWFSKKTGSRGKQRQPSWGAFGSRYHEVGRQPVESPRSNYPLSRNSLAHKTLVNLILRFIGFDFCTKKTRYIISLSEL